MKITEENCPMMKYTRTSPYEVMERGAKEMCDHTSRGGKKGLIFSIFNTSLEDKWSETGGGEWLVDHPDIWSKDVVFEGKCVFFSEYWRISDVKVFSEDIINPTWKDIINEANRQLIDPKDGSTACLYLEGIYEIEPATDGTRFFEFSWGS